MGFSGGGGGSSTPAMAFGTAAARPAAAAGNANTLYYATDTGEPTFSDGAAWHNILAISPNGNGPQLGSNSSLAVKLGPNIALNPVGGTRLQMAASLDISNVGAGLQVAEGSNAKQGVATLAAGTVVVANTSVTATSRIIVTAQDNNTSGAVRISARTAGTSFTITSSNAGDTGVVAWEIFEVG